PALSALVFAEQAAESEVAAALKGSRVFAVLPLPIDPRKTSAVFEGAVADAESRRGVARAAGAEPRPASVSEHKPAAVPETRAEAAAPAAAAPHEGPPRQDSAGGSKVKAFALAGAAFLVVAGAAAWYLVREEAPAPAGPPPMSAGVEPAPAGDAPSAQAMPAAQGDVDELLEKARVAMRERRFIEPENNSALLYYRSASLADPGNPEALDGLNRLRPVIVDRFDELAKAGRHDEAAGALAQLADALPADPAIAGLRLKLASARIAKAIEEGDAERATALVRSAQAASAVPAPQLAKWRSEISRLSEKAKQEEAAERQARDKAAAEQKAREARAAEAAREAQAARERENAKKLEAERAAQAAQAAATTAEAEGRAQKSAGARVEPKLKRNVKPEFPAEAFDKGVSGLVTVAYTVDVEGKTQDVRVESSEPPGVFDKAATNAVKRWRYEPATVDGVPTEAQLRISIRFTMPK
ncbi:MAG TPA: energy transducer TonB, partial [Steroidobacteraceae bacterium]|nr:energy transducer TonB [Steroidobacteraceae bacterium]